MKIWKWIAMLAMATNVGCYQEGYDLREKKGSATTRHGTMRTVFKNVSADVYSDWPADNTHLRFKSFKVEVEEKKGVEPATLISQVDLMKVQTLDPKSPPFFIGFAPKGSFWAINEGGFLFVDASSGQVVRHNCDRRFIQAGDDAVVVNDQTIRRKNEYGVFEFKPTGAQRLK